MICSGHCGHYIIDDRDLAGRFGARKVKGIGHVIESLLSRLMLAILLGRVRFQEFWRPRAVECPCKVFSD